MSKSTLTKAQIVRAWRDPAFRATLTPEQQALFPQHPSGVNIEELSDEQLEQAAGGVTSAAAMAESSGWVCTLTTECNPLTSNCCNTLAC